MYTYRGHITRTRTWGGEMQVDKDLMTELVSQGPVVVIKLHVIFQISQFGKDTANDLWCGWEEPKTTGSIFCLFSGQCKYYTHLTTKQWQDILYRYFSKVKITICFPWQSLQWFFSKIKEMKIFAWFYNPVKQIVMNCKGNTNNVKSEKQNINKITLPLTGIRSFLWWCLSTAC